MENNEFAARIDVREYVPPEKHPAIYQMFESLEAGQKMELVSDHNPKPLFHEFKMERPGTFTWDYLEEGPVVWRVAIGRIKGGE
ncbi:MAG TPA: DUF2249 domain-containing protein [Bacillales bacterium]|nr:DUF2249 domain-containing protein [Bacillales bacterium]